MKFLIDSSSADLANTWVHLKAEAKLATKPYLLEIEEKELETLYEEINDSNKEWNDLFDELREDLGDGVVVGAIIERLAGKQSPEMFEHVIATVDHFCFGDGLLRITGAVEKFEPSKF